jgi:hypothetical protein
MAKNGRELDRVFVTVSASPPFSSIKTATEKKLCKESAKFDVW